PYVSRVILYAVGFQKREILLLEGPLLMVLLLIPDVGYRLANLSDAYAESSVPLLRFEVLMGVELIVHPFRRSGLDQLHCLRNLDGGRQREQHMHVIFYTAYLKGPHLVLPGDPAHKGPEPLLQFGCNVSFPALSAKYAVKEITNVGMSQFS